MIKVYGYSDDNLVIDEDEIGCFNQTVEVRFSDGTVIQAGYPKKNKAIWYINVLKKGIAKQILTMCDDENADVYSDIFEIDADYVSHELKHITDRS